MESKKYNKLVNIKKEKQVTDLENKLVPWLLWWGAIQRGEVRGAYYWCEIGYKGALYMEI